MHILSEHFMWQAIILISYDFVTFCCSAECCWLPPVWRECALFGLFLSKLTWILLSFGLESMDITTVSKDNRFERMTRCFDCEFSWNETEKKSYAHIWEPMYNFEFGSSRTVSFYRQWLLLTELLNSFHFECYWWK